LLFGARNRSAGTIRIDGTVVFIDEPRRAMAAGIGFVPSDRARQGVLPAFALRENLTLPRLAPLRMRGAPAGAISRRRERREAWSWIDRLDIRPREPERRLDTFSGGNQQKIVLAKWLRTTPRVLLLDEPTQGVDVGAKAQIYELLANAAAAGVAVVLTSSDADELANVCDRVLVFGRGRIVAELAGDRLTEDRIATETFGVVSQPAARVGAA